jgi:hypothetical protein
MKARVFVPRGISRHRAEDADAADAGLRRPG